MTDLDTDTEAAHQLFASYDSMEGLPPVDRTRPRRFARLPGVRTFQAVYPGLLAAGVVALAATWLAQHYQAPVMLFALMIGMAFHFLHEEGRCVAGIEFASKAVLRLGVALLGAKITAGQILSLGIAPIVTVLLAVLSTIGLGLLVSRRLGLGRSFGVLSGGSVGICGASAALALASVLPRTKESERDTILAVVTVTALSTVAMILYPMLVPVLGLSHTEAGVFLGGTIHDVAQVVGAGYTISPQTGDVATYVKLLRVTLLLPIVFGVAILVSRRKVGGLAGAKAPIPWFLLGFAALVAAGSLGLLAKPVIETANTVSRAALVAAIAALGMKTSFKSLAEVGWRPVALMVIETVWIAGVVVAAVLLAR